jgi:nitroreductase
MTRNYDTTRAVPRELLLDLVEMAGRAPSAGKTQGWHLVVLEGVDTERYWRHTLAPEDRGSFGWPGLLAAPVIALPFADEAAYLERYSRPDKAPTGLGASGDLWPAPFWTIDTAFSVMTLLLGAEDAGLGTLFFGVARGEAALRAELGVPERLQLLGVIAMGYRAPDGDRPVTLTNRPVRRRPDEIVHFGAW